MTEVYSNLKVFGYPDRLSIIQDGAMPAPVHVRIKPINACNHGCWFCAYRADSLELGQDMKLRDRIPAEKMNEIVEDLIDMKVRAVTFSGGGEPLLYATLKETIEKLGNAGIKIGTLTNGTYLRGEIAEVFAKHATWIRISMDAWDDASCIKSRKVKSGEFGQILENIRTFRAYGSQCSIGVSYIISEDNAPHVYDMCFRLKEVGAEHVKLSPCIVSNKGDETNSYHDRFRSTVLDEIEKASKLNDSSFQVVNHYHQLESTFEKSYTHCPLLMLLTVIGADCTVYTCQDKAYTATGTLGSIKERRFKEYWFSDENRERISTFNPSLQCNHHCVGNEKNHLLNSYLSLDRDHLAFV